MIPSAATGAACVSFPRGRRISFGNGVHEVEITNHYYASAGRNDCDGFLTLSITHHHIIPQMKDVREVWVGKVTFDRNGSGRIEQFSRQVDDNGKLPASYIRQLYTLYGIALHLPNDADPWVLVTMGN